MTLDLKTIGKWLAILGAIASAVIGAVGTGTLPNSVRVVLVVIGAVIVAVERVLSTTVAISVKATSIPATLPAAKPPATVGTPTPVSQPPAPPQA